METLATDLRGGAVPALPGEAVDVEFVRVFRVGHHGAGKRGVVLEILLYSGLDVQLRHGGAGTRRGERRR